MKLTFGTFFRDPANRGKVLLIAGALLALGGAGFLWYVLSDPSPAWVVRWQVNRYLKKHGTPGPFKVEFPFPSRADMARIARPKPTEPAAPLRGSRTGKAFDTLATEYLKLKTDLLAEERVASEREADLRAGKSQLEAASRQLSAAQAQPGVTNLATLQSNANVLRKRVAALEKRTAAQPDLRARERALEPITRDLWEIQRAWMAEAQTGQTVPTNVPASAARRLLAEVSKQIGQATSYAAIYHSIGQELWVAERLLQSARPEHRRVGLDLAYQARGHAFDQAMNPWLAARICEGYLWPNLDAADTSDRRSPLFLDNLCNECARVFRENDELSNVARNYQILLSKATTPQRADWARVQIAMAHEQAGKLQAALDHLRQVRSTNDFRWALNRIPQLEQRLKRR